MRYLSECPHCHTVYHLNLMQMNIAQGNVRCVRCQQRFDAYRCFIHDPNYTESYSHNYLTEIILSSTRTVEERSQEHAQQDNSEYSHYVYDVMQQRIDDSRLNLYTYLNYIDLVSPIHSSSKLGLTKTPNPTKSQKIRSLAFLFPRIKRAKRGKVFYYIAWGIVNIALLIVLFFQILYV